jgi:hypothetical protein
LDILNTDFSKILATTPSYDYRSWWSWWSRYTNQAFAIAVVVLAHHSLWRGSRVSLWNVVMTKDASKWRQWREKHLPPIHFPVQGFDRVHGQQVIDQIDSQCWRKLLLRLSAYPLMRKSGAIGARSAMANTCWRTKPHKILLRAGCSFG